MNDVSMSQFLGHDPLCTWRQAEEADAGDPRRWLAGGLAVCDCDLIAKVRADERHRFDDDGADRDIRERAIRQCIALIEESLPWATGNWMTVDKRAAILTALRSLQEKP